MARMQLPPSTAAPSGIDVSCPLPPDILAMLHVYAPDLLTRSLPTLLQEGLLLPDDDDVGTASVTEGYEVGTYDVPLESVRAGDDGGVVVLAQGEHYVVAEKPPSVVVHHSSWTGRRGDRKGKRGREATPMLQRVRDGTGRRVNPVHRLDRGASGCLVFAFAQPDSGEDDAKGDKRVSCGVTRTLIQSMQAPEATKTYVAFCDGDGTWNGVDYLTKGWFTLDLPVKDEWGKIIENCSTDIRFVAGRKLPPTNDNNNDDDNTEEKEGRKVCIVLTRPSTGRWHQIRQHLASGTLGHAILGDSSHGRSRTNRVWKTGRRLPKERTCLHLARVTLPKTEYTPDGVDVVCPLPGDLRAVLDGLPEDLVEEARMVLREEGVDIL